MTATTTEITGRAKVRLDAHLLADLLDLPEGCRVVALDVSNDPISVNVIVEGPNLLPVPEYAVAPFVPFLACDADRRPRLSLLWSVVTRGKGA